MTIDTHKHIWNATSYLEIDGISLILLVKALFQELKL